MKLVFAASFFGILALAAVIFFVPWKDKRLNPVCPRCGTNRRSRRRHVWNRKAECIVHGLFVPHRG